MEAAIPDDRRVVEVPNGGRQQESNRPGNESWATVRFALNKPKRLLIKPVNADAKSLFWKSSSKSMAALRYPGETSE